jgi:MFS superfamily sulfate permease-like transporter
MSSRFFRFDFVKQDVAAGFVVFLVALPLCLGISLASEAPLLAGIITGIVAGIVVSLISGSELSVSGPAAGLTMTVIAGQHAVGSFEGFLVAVVLSGLIQVVMGLARTGTLAALFPTSVIKGMLAGIGIIIIIKQIPLALGWNERFDVEESLFSAVNSSETFISWVFSARHFVSLGAVVVSILSVGILLAWEMLASRGKAFFKRIPGPLVAVVVAVASNELFKVFFPEFLLTAEAGQLVSLPSITGITDLVASTAKPDWALLANPAVWTTAGIVALIGSIETLLCIEATDKLDPLKRVSHPNRELVAQGIGNMIAGSLGGLPMTSVIVRSSANVYSGGRTRISSFVHGMLLLVCVVVIPTILNLIPLAALASILILVGYKLANASLFMKMYKTGSDQFLPFIVTVLAVIGTDLLTGVLIGTAVGLMVVLRMNYHAAYTLVHEDSFYLIRFAKDATFVQKMKLKRDLARIPNGASILIDGGGAMFIDFDILEILEDFKASAVDRQIAVQVRNFRPSRFRLFPLTDVGGV